jgi:hypothetical protein
MIGLRMSLICFAFALSGSFAWADVVFDGQFNTGDFSRYQLETNGVGYSSNVPPNGVPGHLERVLDPAGSGKWVALATRATGDAPTHGGYRSEMSAPTDSIGSERWYSWGYYLPDTWKDAKNVAVIAQVHDKPDADESGARHAPLVLWIQGDNLKLINSFDYDRVTAPAGTLSIKGVDYEQRDLASWELETGKWTYLDLHVKWAGDDSGFLEFWKDGVLLFQERNHINTFNDERGVWFKNGAYDWSPNSEPISTYSTGVKIGDENETYQSMTMSVVPEPSAYLMMLLGLACIGFIAQRKPFALSQVG